MMMSWICYYNNDGIGNGSNGNSGNSNMNEDAYED